MCIRDSQAQSALVAPAVAPLAAVVAGVSRRGCNRHRRAVLRSEAEGAASPRPPSSRTPAARCGSSGGPC
eukprot:11817376-Alexandrium_andersonii.AAC.1